MNGINILIDTNIALYLLSGEEYAFDLLDGKNVYISFISELELLGYTGITKKEHQAVKTFLKDCIIIELNEPIKQLTIGIKQKIKIKLPDAIIAATSSYLNMALLLGDRGFEKIKNLSLVRYKKLN